VSGNVKCREVRKAVCDGLVAVAAAVGGGGTAINAGRGGAGLVMMSSGSEVTSDDD